MLEVDGVTKVFKTGMFGRGEMTAVSDVSFAVQPGEVVSLIGESGSGKTTVGRMILRLTGATAGAITFDGRDVVEPRPPRAPPLLRATCRASSRTRSARTTPSSRSIASSA